MTPALVYAGGEAGGGPEPPCREDLDQGCGPGGGAAIQTTRLQKGKTELALLYSLSIKLCSSLLKGTVIYNSVLVLF